jgi:small subunit ribosomal protein S4
MSRYTGPRMRIARRLGTLPGLTNKEIKRKSRPGQHGAAPQKKSEFALALEEKQKIRFNYGLTERQMQRYVKAARKAKTLTGEALLRICEMRLDSIVFRLGFAPTIPAARQLVRHGHVHVNGRRVNMPGYQCKPGEVIIPTNKEATMALVKNNLVHRSNAQPPAFLSLSSDKLQASVVSVCSREEVLLSVNERLVVEYYAQRG